MTDPWQILVERWPTVALAASVVIAVASAVCTWLGKKIWSGISSAKVLFEWARPLIEGWFISQRQLGESLPLLLEGVQLTNSVLSSLVRDMPLSHVRDVQSAADAPDMLLVVEDVASDVILFRHHVRAWAESKHLLIAAVMRLGDAVGHLRRSRVCVLDLGVSDGRHPETIRAFIDHADAYRVPVIIFSGRDGAEEYKMGAFAAIQKGDFNLLLEKLGEAIK